MASVRSQIEWVCALSRASWLSRILTLPGSPHAVALGTGIGLFLAFTPTIGTQMVLAGVVATALRASKTAAVVAVWVSNPLTLAPIYAMTYGLGIAIMPQAGPIAALSIGGLLLGLLAGCVGYRLILPMLESPLASAGEWSPAPPPQVAP